MGRDMARNVEGMAGTSALAARYGVTPPTLNNWETRYPNYPTPAVLIPSKRSAIRLWDIEEMDNWVNWYRVVQIAKLPTVPTTATTTEREVLQ
jgi:hypothetical protein